MTDENKAKVSYRLPQKVVEILKAKPNQSAYLENLILNYESGLIVEKSVNETNKELDLDIKRKRLVKLDKEIMRLDIRNRIDLIHALHVPPSVAVEVASGRVTLEQVMSPTKQSVESFQGTQKSWHHFCKSVNRTVEFQIDIKECKWCGVEQ